MAGSISVGGVHADLSLNSAKFDAGLKKTGSELDRFGKKTKGAAAIVSSAMSTVGNTGVGAFKSFALGATAALAPILSITAALNTAKAALSDFDNLGNKAKMFGVDVERLQELRFAAEQSGMAVDNFDTALRRFIRRSSEAAKGTGAAKDAFKELGIELHDNTGRLKDSHDLLGEVADALQRVPNQADKLRLAFKMFDTDGAAMVNVLANGSAGLDEFARKARDLGLVVDRELIARTQEMKSEFDTATKVIDLNFKQALVNLAPILVSTASLASDIAAAVRRIVDAFTELEGKSTNALDEQMRTLGLERLEVENEILRLQGEQGRMGNTNRMIFEADIADARRRLEAISAEEAKILAILSGRKPSAGAPIVPDQNDNVPPIKPSSTRNSAAEAALKQAEAVRALVANLEHEQAQLGRTAAEQELYNALKAVGVERESAFGQQIESTLGPLQAKREEIQRNAEAMALLESAATGAMQTIVDGFLDGKDAAEVFGNALRDVGRQLISMGIGSLGNMLFPGAGTLAGGVGGGGHFGSTFNFGGAA